LYSESASAWAIWIGFPPAELDSFCQRKQPSLPPLNVEPVVRVAHSRGSGRDCLDHVLIFGERHLRRILTLYSVYYNETRTHLGLGKDAPQPRPIQRCGTLLATPILSVLHNRYSRI